MKIFQGGDRFFRRSVAPEAILAVEYNPLAMAGLGIEDYSLFDFFGRFQWRVWRLTDACGLIPVSNPGQMPARDVSNLLVSRLDLPRTLGLPETIS